MSERAEPTTASRPRSTDGRRADVASWPLGLTGVGYGADYNPEQWADEVRVADIQLMVEAGVSIVSLAVFAWARIEPREGEYDWTWLDDTMDRLAAAGIRVTLATATASPPPWLSTKHPEILPELADGTVLWPGGRQHYRVSSPVYRDYVVRLTRAIARRYGTHPALAMWHVDNEIGCHVPHDYSDDAARGFRRWLENRYGTIEALNHAWGTAFWSQQYSDFAEVLPPRTAPTFPNPTHQLDFRRYSSDELLSYYQDIRAVLAEETPHVPCTTNFMVMAGSGPMDYYGWAPHMDVVSNDHYVQSADPHPERDIAFSADSVRSMAGGAPWLLMEHSTSAVNWQGHNRSRTAAESHRHSLAHVAHGADGVMFFQWRQSQAGAEKYHSAMLPHAGTDTDVWRGAVRLGEILRAIGEVQGSRVQARAAVLYEYPSVWAARMDSHPSDAIDPRAEAARYHHALARRGITADVVPPSSDLSGYDVVVVPELYLVSDADAANVAAAARRGATVLVTYFSGIVDPDDRVRLGGYPGAFRELLGVRTEEFWALQPGEEVTLDDGSTGTVWSERLHAADGTDAVRRFAGGPLDGGPAVTRRPVDAGTAWYVATRPSDEAVWDLVDAIVRESGVEPVAPDLADGLEVTRRTGPGASWLFVLNHADTALDVRCAGLELISGVEVAGALTVPAGGVAVVRERAAG
ncbi:beta-galactosidase [Cellulomonas endometrii]|uniref:beta-galactosidase n=1 Tax=Cellulomonas endometrii TaxID=3036301 RepID=UPI0024ADA0E3|nr:beta-galactosidase [Cellulomonas endometrii]